MAAEASIFIGVLIVDVEVPGATSLKEKRSAIVPITERLRVRFKVSVARLAGLDSRRWERLGICLLGSNAVVVERLLNRALDFIAARDVQIVASRIDLDVWEPPEVWH